jgi:coenzyme Q-binding protein COQ10
MPSFETKHRIRHSAAEMFALVADVESYPQFLPLCEGLRVRSRKETEGKLVLVADMDVGYRAIRETFTSRVTCEREALKILVEYIDGPFHHLENRWSFQDIEGGAACLVDFRIEYEFRSRMLGLLMGKMFDVAFHKFVDAFEKRGDLVYGRAKRLARRASAGRLEQKLERDS